MTALRLWLAVAVVLAIGGAYGAGVWQGYRAGAAAAEARHQAAREKLQRELFAAGEALSRRAAELEDARAAQSDLAMEIENEAHDDPDGVRRGIGPDGLRRLKRRWGAP